MQGKLLTVLLVERLSNEAHFFPCGFDLASGAAAGTSSFPMRAAALDHVYDPSLAGPRELDWTSIVVDVKQEGRRLALEALPKALPPAGHAVPGAIHRQGLLPLPGGAAARAVPAFVEGVQWGAAPPTPPS